MASVKIYFIFSEELIKQFLFKTQDHYLYATSLYKNGLTCKNIIEAGDKVQLDFQVFSIITNIWSKASCESKLLISKKLFTEYPLLRLF